VEVITTTLDFLVSDKEWVNMFLRLILGLNRLERKGNMRGYWL